MTSVTALAEELKRRVQFQHLPDDLPENAYETLIANAIRRLFIDTGRALKFHYYTFASGDHIPIPDPDKEYDPEQLYFTYAMNIDEEEYVLIIAQMDFLQMIQMDVNTITSYTTNALSVTGADKPYAHLADSIDKLENLRRELLYRMIRYMTGASC